jgi:hypothetical protein
MTNPLACQHCGKPVWQPEKHGEWYHDDSAGTLRCCEGKQIANPVASQQPAPIPVWPKWCEEGDHPYFAISNGPTEYKCIICHLYEENDRMEAALRAVYARLKKALQRIRSCDAKNGHVMKEIATEALSTPLGTLGSTKEDENGR